MSTTIASYDEHSVVAVVDVPAHSVETVLATSGVAGCAAAAAEAWDQVKAADDASFADMSDSYRRELVYAAEGVYKTGKILEGDSTLARFERAVYNIQAAQAKAAEEAAPAEEPPAVEEVAKSKQGPLPGDFPGHQQLADAGINTYAQARKQRDGEGLEAVPGIGPATAVKINEALED